MANIDSKITTNAANLHLYYEKKLLSTLEPRLVLQPLGKKQKLPKGLGDTVKWLRYAAINANTAPIATEGTPPDSIAFTTSNVTATVLQYGQFARISDLLSDVAIDPVLENLSERFGIAAAKTIEQLIVNELDATASVQFINNKDAATLVAGDELDHKELVEAMIRQKADFIGPHESGSYVAVLHPKAEYDIMTDVQAGSMLDLRKYTDPKNMLNGEIGKMYGMRFLVSDKMTNVAANSPNVAYINAAYVIGEEAFGVVELDGNSVKMINKKHGSGGTSDPLDQIATVGYKIHGFAAKYLELPVGGVKSKRVIVIKGLSSI